jgi:hypothetical protein
LRKRRASASERTSESDKLASHKTQQFAKHTTTTDHPSNKALLTLPISDEKNYQALPTSYYSFIVQYPTNPPACRHHLSFFAPPHASSLVPNQQNISATLPLLLAAIAKFLHLQK